MKFEENFPSLKLLYFESDPIDDYVYTEDVQKHCLDKAKVKEALERFLKKINVKWDDWIEFKKALGLDK